MTTIRRANVLSQFTCLGERCEDTCCQTWSMQVDGPTIETYRKEAPELLSAVEQAKEAPWIMKKNPATGFCVKLDGGLCGIHKDYGDRFLGDACHFYPRVTRALGDQLVMTATMSCPEIVRRALLEPKPCSMEEADIQRLPSTLKDYLPEGMTPQDALAVHQAFISATEDESADAEQIMLRIASASRSLERIDKKSWAAMAEFYLKNADMRIPAAEVNDADPFNLLHALCGLIIATHKSPSERLRDTVADMEKALGVTLDWEKVAIQLSADSASRYQSLQALWEREAAQYYMPVLRRYLQMEMSLALYPFSGLGTTLEGRATIIGVRLATIKLALLCGHSIYCTMLPQDVVVRVIQSLSRFMDHLGDPAFSLNIYAETGWIKEAKMHGLLKK